MRKLSTSTVQTVKKMLPELRKKLKEEYKEWAEYKYGDNFNSDEKVVELLPLSFQEFIVIYRKIYTDKDWAVYCLNDITKERMADVITLTLKRLALIDYVLSGGKEKATTASKGKRSRILQ